MKNNKGIHVLANIVLVLMAIAAILPLLLMVASSFTDEQELVARGYSLLPGNVSLDAYKYLFSGAGNILRSYGVTLFVTVFGTAMAIFLTVTLGYTLSVRDLPGRGALAFLVFFTMLFNGGLVPTYIMYSNTFHIKNTIWALIIPALLLNAFNVILARSFFETSIPPAIIEAARIDGASEIKILFSTVLPMSLPIMATLGLMIGLAYWNNWTNGLYYVTKKELYSIQQLLTEIMRNIQVLQSGQSGISAGDLVEQSIPSTSLRMAIAVAGVIPIMIIYPVFQKYFVKGMTLGAVKE